MKILITKVALEFINNENKRLMREHVIEIAESQYSG